MYKKTDHVCRICFGRLLSFKDAEGADCIECADCGTKKKGTHLELCACGNKFLTGKKAGFRCVKNGETSPERPNEIVIKFVGDV